MTDEDEKFRVEEQGQHCSLRVSATSTLFKSEVFIYSPTYLLMVSVFSVFCLVRKATYFRSWPFFSVLKTH